jgi:hypothetical protein
MFTAVIAPFAIIILLLVTPRDLTIIIIMTLFSDRLVPSKFFYSSIVFCEKVNLYLLESLCEKL